MKVQLLYFEGCPGYRTLCRRVRALIGNSADLELRTVEFGRDGRVAGAWRMTWEQVNLFAHSTVKDRRGRGGNQALD